MACTTVTYYNWRRMLMLRYTIHANTPCISTMPALVHFLISFQNRILSLLMAVPVTFFRNSTLRCTRSKLACLAWKLKPTKSGTINTKTKTVAHNRVRDKRTVHFSQSQDSTRTKPEDNPEWCFYHNTYGERARKCKQPCSFNHDRHNVQQLHSKKLNKSLTDPFADMYNTHWCYYHTRMVIVHAIAHSHVLTSKTIHRTCNT